MKTTQTLLAALLVASALAGCMDGGKEAEASDSPTGSGTATETATGSSNPIPNQAPTVVVKLLLNGTELVLTNGSYELPALENVTFDASGSSDPEDAALSFAWDLGDNTTSPNASVVHAYAKGGNYTVTVTVSDGALSTEESRTLVVADAGPLRTDTKVFQGTLLVGTQDPAVAAAPCGALGEEDIDQKTFEWTFVGQETDGTMSYVGHVLIKLDSSGTAASDVDIQFLDPAGKKLGEGVTASADETVELKDVRLGAGKYSIRVYACNVADIDVAVTASATYFPA